MSETLIYARLAGHAGVSALVATRIYPLLIPQEPRPAPDNSIRGQVYPAISYQRIASDHVGSLQGHSGLVNARVQLDCWALSYNAAKQLAAQVKDAMAGAYDNKFSALLQTDLDDYEPDTRLYRVSMDFSIWYSDEVTN